MRNIKKPKNCYSYLYSKAIFRFKIIKRYSQTTTNQLKSHHEHLLFLSTSNYFVSSRYYLCIVNVRLQVTTQRTQINVHHRKVLLEQAPIQEDRMHTSLGCFRWDAPTTRGTSHVHHAEKDILELHICDKSQQLNRIRLLLYFSVKSVTTPISKSTTLAREDCLIARMYVPQT